MLIPSHSLFKLYKNNEWDKPILSDAQFIVEESLSIPIKSEFGNLYTAPSNSLTDIMSMISVVSSDYKNSIAGQDVEGVKKMARGAATLGTALSGKFKEFGFQIYKSSSPLEINLSVSLYATYNAYTQVYYPVTTLMKMPLPTTQNELNDYGVSTLLGLDSQEEQNSFIASSKKGVGNSSDSDTNNTTFSSLIPPGPSASILLPKNKENEKTDFNAGRVFSCSIGNMFFNDIFITGVTPTFSSEKMNVNNKYYPMSCKLQLDIRGVFVLTKAVIQKMIENNTLI